MTIKDLKQIQNNLQSAGFKDSAAIVSRFRSDPAALAAFLHNDFSILGGTPQTIDNTPQAVQNGTADAPQAVQIGKPADGTADHASALSDQQTADDNKPSADNAQRSAMVRTSAMVHTSADDPQGPQTIASTPQIDTAPQVIDCTPPASPDLVRMEAVAPDFAATAPQVLEDCPQTMQASPQAVPALRPVDDIVPAQTDILQDTTDYTDLLPASLYYDISSTIDDYCKTHAITDKKKIHPLEWQAVCHYIGQYIKKTKIIHDFPREKKQGGIFYDGHKVAALLDLYGMLCSEYKQVAFSHNFPAFAGVSREYFNDYAKRGLTSSRVGLPQKAAALQRASIVGAINGGGSATVGNIFLGKALAGLQETSTVVHVSAAPSVGMEELPKLGRLDG